MPMPLHQVEMGVSASLYSMSIVIIYVQHPSYLVSLEKLSDNFEFPGRNIKSV